MSAIELTEEEAILIVYALGVTKNEGKLHGTTMETAKALTRKLNTVYDVGYWWWLGE